MAADFLEATTMNLCSKCYSNHRLKEEHAASTKVTFEKALSPPTPMVVVAETTVEALCPSSTVELAPSMDQQAPGQAKPANRCESCNKKVDVVGFKCKCGSTFCGSHRFAEAHGCTLDFKGAGRDAIAKAKLVVKANKLQRF